MAWEGGKEKSNERANFPFVGKLKTIIESTTKRLNRGKARK